MRMRAAAAAFLLLAASVAGAAGRPSWGVVTGDDVRVRSGPAEGYRDMCRLDQDELVEVVAPSEDGRWLRIAPPAKGDVWVYAKYVRVNGARGVLTGDKVRVRVRPDLKGEQVNRLDKGTVVTVKGREGEWIKIAPPAGSAAWISAAFVQRMTDDELALFKRKKADEARRKEELARKRREGALVAAADRRFAAELRKAISRRSLTPVVAAYRDAERRVRDEMLRNKVRVQLVVLGAMQNVQSALARKTPPAELPKFDFDQAKRQYGVGREVDALLAAHQLAQKVAREQVIAQPPGREQTLDGWVFYLGPGLEQTGATHRLIRDGAPLALLRGEQVHLDSFVGERVRVTGRATGQAAVGAGRTEIVEITRVETALK